MNTQLRRRLALSKVIAKAWTDPQFKKQLIQDPKKVLTDNGVEIDAKKDLKVVENTDSTQYFLLPEPPSSVGTLSQEDLYSAAGSELEFSGLINKDSGNA